MIKEYEFKGKTIDAALEKGLAELGMDRDDVHVEILERPKGGFLGIGAVEARIRISYDDGKPEPSPEKEPAESAQKTVAKPVFNVSKEKLEQLKEKEKATPREARREEKTPAPGGVQPYLYEKIPADPSTKAALASRTAEKKPSRRSQERRGGRGERSDRAPKAPDRPFEKKPVSDEAPIPFLIGLLDRMGIEANAEITDRSPEAVQISLEGPRMGKLIGRHGETMDSIQYICSLAYNRTEEGRTRIIIDTENYREKRERTLASLARRMADNAVRQNRAVTLEPMSPTERRIIHTTLQQNDRVTTFSTGVDPARRVVISPVDASGEAPAPARSGNRRGHRGGRRRSSRNRRPEGEKTESAEAEVSGETPAPEQVSE